MTVTIDTGDLLLLAPVPFLLICAVWMTVGLFTGPHRGGFRMVLTWPWLWVVLPTIFVGLYGIAKEVFG